MGGEELARAIKAVPRFAKVPLVLQTSPPLRSAGEMLETGLFVATLSKPADRSQLFEAVCWAVAATASSEAQSSASDSDEAKLSIPLRVLVAEDNEVNRMVAAGLAERLGCQIDVVQTGREVLEALDYDRHDLILMDVQMPEMDGLTATASIRERERDTGKHIPIIAMTAHAMEGDRERCLSAGMDDYLTKPLLPGPFREVLLACVCGKGGSAKKGRTTRQGGGMSFSPDLVEKSCGNNPRRVQEVLELMLKGAAVRLQRLKAALAARDNREVSSEAHGLKGAFLMVGADNLAAACEELVRLSDRVDWASIEVIHGRLSEGWGRLAEELNLYLDTRTRCLS
jgi:CheY-like chemotaxis protein